MRLHSQTLAVAKDCLVGEHISSLKSFLNYLSHNFCKDNPVVAPGVHPVFFAKNRFIRKQMKLHPRRPKEQSVGSGLKLAAKDF